MVGEGAPLRVSVERAWRRSGWAWSAWTVASLAGAAALTASVVLLDGAKASSAVITSRLAPILSPPSASPGTALAQADFVRQLVTRTAVSDLIRDLQQACSDAGVTLATVQAQEKPPSTDQLGRVELAANLRGPYQASHRVLKHMVERHPALTVGKLRMRRAAAGNEIETAVTLSLWSAPLIEPASSGRQ